MDASSFASLDGRALRALGRGVLDDACGQRGLDADTLLSFVGAADHGPFASTAGGDPVLRGRIDGDHRVLPALYEALRALSVSSRDRGVFYTPGPLVRCVVARALERPGDGRTLDPSCGAGAFLLEVARLVLPDASAEERLARLPERVHGVELDPQAALVARAALVLEAIPRASRGVRLEGRQAPSVRIDDALLGAAPDLMDGFACVLGNPPFASARALARTVGKEVTDRLRERYPTARGAFDLWVPFLELSLRCVQPGGSVTLVLPNKLLSAEYARPMRSLLTTSHTIEEVCDLSHLRPFARAAVYPLVVKVRRGRAVPHASARIRRPTSMEHLGGPDDELPDSALSAGGFVLGGSLGVEERVATLSLSAVAEVHAGAAGFDAERVAAALVDGEDPRARSGPSLPFLTTGSIDRYRLDASTVRFLGRTLLRPRLLVREAPLTTSRLAMLRGDKIVVAGMSRRLEATLDRQGHAMGVQTYAIRGGNLDLRYLLALLDSALFTYLFATRFAGKRLGGGYLSVNKGQLAALPVHVPHPGDPRQAEIIALVDRLLGGDDPQGAVDRRIDELVFDLYRVDPAERAAVVGGLAETSGGHAATRPSTRQESPNSWAR